MTPFSLTSQYLQSMVLEDFFCSFIFLPIHPYSYTSIFIFTHPNDGWTGLYIKYASSVIQIDVVGETILSICQLLLNCMRQIAVVFILGFIVQRSLSVFLFMILFPVLLLVRVSISLC